MAKHDHDKIVIEGEKLKVWHELKNISQRFKYTPCYSACMARDKSKCQADVEAVANLLEELLI